MVLMRLWRGTPPPLKSSHDAAHAATEGCYGTVTIQVDWVLVSIKATINSLHDEGQTWRKIAATAEVSPGLVHHIARGRFEHASWETVRKLSLHLLQNDPGPLEYVLTCPTCGGAHVLADCHGAEIVAIVALTPGETVHRPGKPRTRRRYLRPCLSRDPAERLEQLGRLWRETYMELAYSKEK